MTPNEAYRLGQEHMKRKLARRYRNWSWGDIGAAHDSSPSQNGKTFAGVAVSIRREHVDDLPKDSA